MFQYFKMVSHSFVVFHRKDCFETISSNEIDFFKSLFKPLLLKKKRFKVYKMYLSNFIINPQNESIAQSSGSTIVGFLFYFVSNHSVLSLVPRPKQ